MLYFIIFPAKGKNMNTESAPMKKILVTGASGFLGYTVCCAAASEFRVVGSFFSHEPVDLPIETAKVDLTDYKQIKDFLSIIHPQVVIHTAALADPNTCEQSPADSYKINVQATENLATLCQEINAKFIFTSTDLVFDGFKGNYREDDQLNPLNIYGEHKALAEEKIIKINPRALICRMPLMFGSGSPFSTSFLQPILQKLKQGKEIPLFTDEFRSPVSGLKAAQGLLMAMDNCEGIVHLGGRQRLSRYEFGLQLAAVYGISAKLKLCSQKDILMAAARPADVSLNSSKAYSLGYDPGELTEELQRIKAAIL